VELRSLLHTCNQPREPGPPASSRRRMVGRCAHHRRHDSPKPLMVVTAAFWPAVEAASSSARRCSAPAASGDGAAHDLQRSEAPLEARRVVFVPIANASLELIEPGTLPRYQLGLLGLGPLAERPQEARPRLVGPLQVQRSGNGSEGIAFVAKTQGLFVAAASRLARRPALGTLRALSLSITGAGPDVAAPRHRGPSLLRLPPRAECSTRDRHRAVEPADSPIPYQLSAPVDPPSTIAMARRAP